ncbi:hypothetical protein SERLA73DRAFT_186401 [Serpula lacrymans var. lacrymans S7.3]|uniref:NADP-dependent oxidoreductase domain-containing protein n=2 Tax=Serpula lacrymans var. lacrymans TaxID=341189 RepID=F8Q782_SERL3|nr:uncharacterized protein SERLADRAFT_475422 [Serpula lacrymans var. lacrymans S7.9]EGN95420.1 hypothetical protein SERLA73DRAFT_186401 [Serpula lacrymans var. lacrymans S7.3]EGO20952.1 hypothetical protein SERLADRAFT_475422 [Serpula lacrymans var. lacrymans S7.9]
MTLITANLGGTASNVVVNKVGHGLMFMTWKEVPTPDEECFESIKAGVDALPPGVKMFLNGGEFYGHNRSTANLEMISRFFEKYPDYADKTFLSIKGGVGRTSLVPDSSPENLKASVDTIVEKLRGKKRLDLFECARVDPKVPVEDAIKVLSGYVKEGKFDHIGMSECSAESLRRGHAVHPIAAVEIEVSPWSYEEETQKVIATSKELGIAVIAYSPLGRGFLTGQIKSLDDIPADDMRRHLSRFKPENFNVNFKIVVALSAIAKRKNVSPAQLSVAWVGALGKHVIPLPGSSHAKRTIENLVGGDVELSADDMKEIEHVMNTHEIKGDRYFGGGEAYLWG